jgi:hypothetical protein
VFFKKVSLLLDLLSLIPASSNVWIHTDAEDTNDNESILSSVFAFSSIKHLK